ncbi:hypothetical protein Agub_g12181, partial [Astrephomene gubernaculifera]
FSCLFAPSHRQRSECSKQCSRGERYRCSIHGKLKKAPETYNTYDLTATTDACEVDGTAYQVDLHFNDEALHTYLGFAATKASAIMLDSRRRFNKLVLTPLLDMSDDTLTLTDATLRVGQKHVFVTIRAFHKAEDPSEDMCDDGCAPGSPNGSAPSDTTGDGAEASDAHASEDE